MAAKDPITCHILDTTLGQPARNVRVRLEHTTLPPTTTPAPSSDLSSAAPTAHPTSLPIVFESRTDEDGRVRSWLPYSSPQSPGEVPVYTLEDVLGDIRGSSRWTLRFDTGPYFAAGGRETFFPEVAVVFEVAEGQHYHVPLLLSPFGYSTYRGS
ncbi:Hydroxyisourate hydrolase [Cryphonectria parasitica EP155]|uniref:hydroxyisourate hydrolase n=1 Tax=Cryphonectria parasitica (strain ATCC 38755 / EP155) TaxID=660469 RepID=A0A9P5CKB4_CRYP1|nr:Hydroxyisourate hydrolase [Cryphonectria parasitica EP155]KAF3760776.1 Hydroxyisourate hydrolase [Cryphonectria parasitica EP155]